MGEVTPPKEENGDKPRRALPFRALRRGALPRRAIPSKNRVGAIVLAVMCGAVLWAMLAATFESLQQQATPELAWWLRVHGSTIGIVGTFAVIVFVATIIIVLIARDP